MPRENGQETPNQSYEHRVSTALVNKVTLPHFTIDNFGCVHYEIDPFTSSPQQRNRTE